MMIMTRIEIIKGLVCAILLINVQPILGQVNIDKPSIDSSTYGKWPDLTRGKITGDGKYALYIIENQPFGGKTHVVVSTDAKWRKEYTSELKNMSLISNRYALLEREEGIGVLKLGTDEIEDIGPVLNYKQPFNTVVPWIAFQSADLSLTVRNQENKRELHFNNVSHYEFSLNGNVLVLETIDNTKTHLIWVDLNSGKNRNFWSGGKPGNITFDSKEKKLAFTTLVDEDRQLWYYDGGQLSAMLVGDARLAGMKQGTMIDRIIQFSKDGNRIFVALKDKVHPKPASGAVGLDIWTYKDEFIQTAQLGAVNSSNRVGVFFVGGKKMILLADEEMGSAYLPQEGNDDWVLVSKFILAPGSASKYTGTLVSTKDGTKKPVLQQAGSLSLSGKYIVYSNYPHQEKGFLSYEIATGVTRNITKDIITEWDLKQTNGADYPRGVAGWCGGEDAVLIYDLYDIWKVDLSGKKAPINLTNGYGRRNKIMFFLRDEHYMTQPLVENELILTAVNTQTKDNGFYRISVGKTKDPELLTMGPYVYSLTRNAFVSHVGNRTATEEPVKAVSAETYLVRRQSATEYPNIYSTKDFKNFTRLSDLHPEKAYNWYNTRLHSFKLADGRESQGILFVPENFDPSKKYPVIFHYYTRNSDNLNVYLHPWPSDGRLNILWYVSNGYLVFTPDLLYKRGNAYESATQTLVAAANHIAKLPYVNANKMGMQGISWGGFQTNYFVTHTDIFAAACSSSGVADFISIYNGTTHGGALAQDAHESGDHGSGKSLWEDKDWYIKNSPVMSADKVSTPLLMFHTSVDDACPYYNAIELFLALRRLGKKAWLLEYNEGNHAVWGKSALDFDLRMQQFFNHYLKNDPAPMWMTRGRPAKLKWTEERTELDLSNITP